MLGCLLLRWPYTDGSATCSNARVLERVTQLLREGPMPGASPSSEEGQG